MSPQQLHTRQYFGGHAIRVITTAALVGLAAWFGFGTAHADTNHERQACALMDDHADAMRNGYSSYPSEYAFVVLSTEMPPLEAAHTLRAATQDVCPGHAADLPRDWQ
ncbi:MULTISPECIES: hypothetical protein [unclassified Mycobacterium]|uniref:hypothetical protein n=1 Tax=unclassified Mycobacterium TaxID=2642494 RepID=UPI0007FC8719|nr:MULTISPECIES: hypothetical protein [unclassified Mycobacterium]OBH08449.1 hypothetical protein A5696_19895 [Mycobacterium sp. E2699]OBI48462.1 hypothetical protein A5705_15975 [Mycobacterium sp. E787]